MAKNNQPQTNSEQKVQTKYDRKMEERKKQEAKDKKDAKAMRIGAIVVSIAIIAAIAVSIALPIVNKQAAVKDTYVTVGNHEITQLEYDYFFNASVNNYVTMYSSFLGYMGLDPQRDLDTQQYSEEMTWKDFFDQMAVEQIKNIKALADDAAANNFAYDDTEDYKKVIDGIKTNAETAEVSVADYYKTTFGEYATEKNVESIMKEEMLASAYYESLLEKNAPTDQEVKDYYAEHVQDYDKVDYRSFVFTADTAEDASEEDTKKAMEDAKSKADAMVEARQGGADFKALCLENAAEEDKATYEDTETDASLKEGAYYVGIPAAISGWLYEDGRAEGDITVIEDAESSQYFVVEFINRYYDEADDENIASVIANERVTAYTEKLIETYAVTDNKGELKYLTIDTSAEAETEAEVETESTEETAEDTVESTEEAGTSEDVTEAAE